MGNDNESLVLTPEQVRQRLKISRSVLYSSLKNGTIPSIRLSPRKILIPKQRFLAWLNEAGGNDLHSKNEKAPGVETGASRKVEKPS